MSAGGPGTGKVTLSEAVVQSSNGKLGHISMTKVLKEYAKHFGQSLTAQATIYCFGSISICTTRPPQYACNNSMYQYSTVTFYGLVIVLQICSATHKK